MLRHTATIAFCLLAANQLFAQEITGQVTDHLTKEPIPFAHVTLGNTTTISNIEGQFVILKEHPEDTTIQVSFIGFEPFTQNVNEQTYFEVEMKESTLSLDAVTVLTGDILMQRVFERLITNYEMEPLRLTSYYKEKLLSDSSMVYLAEGVLDILLPSNVRLNNIKIAPIKTRKNVMKPKDIGGHATMMSGHAHDMAISSIWRKNSFLSKRNRRLYQYEYEGKRSYQEHSIYEVSFTPKHRKGYVSGTLYIEDETYAIVKMGYEPDADRSPFWEYAKWTEEFEFLKGRYHLTSVSYTGQYFELEKAYEFKCILVNNNINSDNLDNFPHNEMSKTDVFFEEAENDLSEEYWNGYHYIKLSTSELQVRAN